VRKNLSTYKASYSLHQYRTPLTADFSSERGNKLKLICILDNTTGPSYLHCVIIYYCNLLFYLFILLLERSIAGLDTSTNCLKLLHFPRSRLIYPHVISQVKRWKLEHVAFCFCFSTFTNKRVKRSTRRVRRPDGPLKLLKINSTHNS